MPGGELGVGNGIAQIRVGGEVVLLEISLQIAVKAINDLVGPDGIIPILLVFGAYPRITNNSALSPITTKRAKTICKTTKEI